MERRHLRTRNSDYFIFRISSANHHDGRQLVGQVCQSSLFQAMSVTFGSHLGPHRTLKHFVFTGIHASSVRRAITNLEMPAMSPTMELGGIASWKKKEGESFVAGDVLLEIVSSSCLYIVEAGPCAYVYASLGP